MPVLLADDLTGACDVGAESMRNGWRVRVTFPWGVRAGGGMSPRPGEVSVLDLETRRMTPREAGRRMEQVGWALARRKIHPAFFKMDSTLRGNFPQESAALRRALGADLVWFVPANPAQGRWTIGGRVFVEGLPLENSPFAHDPIHPVSTGEVARLVEAESGRGSCRVLALHGLRAGREARTRWLRQGSRFAVADVMGEDDFRAFAALVGRRDLVFGAAPASRFLVGAPARRFKCRPRPVGRWLGILGSLNPRTRAQVDSARKMSGVRVTLLRPRELFSRRLPRPPSGGFMWLVALDAPAFRGKLGGGGAALEEGNRMARELGRLADALSAEWGPSGLVLSGGLTAAGVCEQMGIHGLELLAEPSPGLVWARAEWEGPELAIITKPGGFGAEDALAEIARTIRRKSGGKA